MPTATANGAAWPLVGRDAELARATAAIAAGPGGVVIVGSAGVGKTRIAREVVDRLAAAGHRVETVAGTRTGAGIPFGAFARFVNPDLRHDDPTGQLWHLSDRLRGAGPADSGTPVPVRPILLVDDAHLLDAGSAAAVHHLAVSGSVSVVLTFLDGQRIHDAVSRVWRDGYATAIELGRLDRTAVGRMIEAGLGGPVDEYTLGRLYHLTDGNPLLLRDLVDAARAEGALRADGGGWRWTGDVGRPRRLEQALAETLADAPTVGRDALLYVALAGPLPTDTLTALTDGHAVEDMCERGLLAPVEHGGTVALTQPLHAPLLLASAPRLALRRLRKRLAGAVDGRADLFLRVKLLADAGESPAAEDLIAAAEQAAKRLDGETAERLARLAPPGTPGRVLALARALAMRRNFEEAELILAEAEPDRPDLEIAAARIVNYIRGLRRPDLARAYLADLTRTLDATTPMVLQVFTATLTRDYAAAAAACATDPMLEAISVDDTAGWAVYQLAGAYFQLGRTTESLQLLLRHYRQDMPPETALALRFGIIGTLQSSGRPDEAAGWCTELIDWGARVGWPAASCTGLAGLGGVLLYQGRAVEAAGKLRQAAGLAREHAPGSSHHWILNQLAMAEAAAGKDEEARVALRKAAAYRAGHETPYLYEQERRAEAFVSACLGETTAALGVLDELVGPSLEQQAWAQTLEIAALMARLGETRRAADLVAKMPIFTDSARVTVEYINALRARSPEQLIAASAGFEDVGAIGMAAEAADHAAHWFRQQGPSRQLAAARRTSDRLWADTGSPPLGWWPSSEQITLSRREREIARLAAAGRSNPDIAAMLVLSVRTVENHLHRVYAKLGVSGRAELPAAIGMRRDPPH